MFVHYTLRNALRNFSLLSAAFVFPSLISAQAATSSPRQLPADSVISLAPQSQAVEHHMRTEAVRATGIAAEPSYENAPKNFHAFASARTGQDAGVEPLTLNFSAATTLSKIASTSKDFVVESGGTCQEGKSFSAGESCTMLVRFNPQGAGNRTGKLQVGFSTGAKPQAVSIGLGGYGYAPVVSFTPAVITTLTGTYPSSAGLFSGATGLAIDGNDTLYVADTGNNLVRFFDSSNTWQTLASGYTAPLGVTTDTFGEVYFDLSGSNHMYEVYDYGPTVEIDGTGTASCPASTPCTVGSEALSSPGLLTNDPYNHLFFPENHSGVGMITAQPSAAKLAFLYDPFPYQETPVAPVGVDSSDNLYTPWQNGGVCEIVRQSLYDAENSNVNFTKIAGGHTCGFSGDGGQAGNAEISSRIGGIVFDLTGNLYFTDTANQRVRRIDYTTGQINTIAGNGTAGYTGDNGPATSATLSTPTGIGVDSTGAVYVLSSASSKQVIRKIGPDGVVWFPSTTVGTAANSLIASVSNTGNAALQIINVVWHGGNPTDFKIDPWHTTCDLNPGATLEPGESCKISVSFLPTAAGTRSATFSLITNSVAGLNNLNVAGSAVRPTPSMSINSPASGATITAGTAFTFKASVSSSSSPAPTGTVSFYVDGGAVTGNPFALSSGSAQASVTLGVTGTRTLKAVYNGDTNYSSTSVQESITVVSASSTPAHIIWAPGHRNEPVRVNPAPQQ